jgi:hypothetical protein
MRARTSLILVAGIVLGAAVVTRRFLSLVGAISGLPLWGYGAVLRRPPVVSIPGDWVPPVLGTFNKQTMNNLADLGERMGADPASWSSEPREPSTAQRVSYAGTKPS